MFIVLIFFFFFFWLFRYGPIFKTSVAGRPIIISKDVEFNHYLAKQEGGLVELWCLDSLANLFNQDGENKPSAIGHVHMYVRSIILNHFGTDSLKETLPFQIEEFVNKTYKHGQVCLLLKWNMPPQSWVLYSSPLPTFLL